MVPGTTDGVVLPLLEEASGRAAGRDFGVGMNPEFLTEGQAVADFMEPGPARPRSGIDERTHAALEELYAGLSSDGATHADEHAHGGDDQVRVECAAGDERSRSRTRSRNLCAAVGDVDVVDVMRGVHVSRYLTATSRGRRAGAGADLSSFLDGGLRLRRELPAEGRPGADRATASGSACRCHSSRP